VVLASVNTSAVRALFSVTIPSIWSKHLFRYFAIFIAPYKNYTYCKVNKQQYIHILAKHKTTYLDYVDEPLGSVLYPCRLLGLGELFVADEVVPTLAPHENVLATIMGAPLDLFHFIV